MTLVRTNRDKYTESPIGDQVLPGIQRVQLESDSCATTPTIAHINLTDANTEISYSFPVNTKQFRIRSQSGFKFQIGYTSGSATYSVPLKTEYCISDICVDALIIFVSSSKDNIVLEVESWA